MFSDSVCSRASVAVVALYSIPTAALSSFEICFYTEDSSHSATRKIKNNRKCADLALRNRSYAGTATTVAISAPDLHAATAGTYQATTATGTTVYLNKTANTPETTKSTTTTSGSGSAESAHHKSTRDPTTATAATTKTIPKQQYQQQ